MYNNKQQRCLICSGMRQNRLLAAATMYMTMATIHMLIGAILIFALILVIGNENRVIGHVYSKGAAAPAALFRSR